MKEVVIVDAVRTPVGNLGGRLSSFRAEELAALTLRQLIDKTRLDPAMLDDVYFGSSVLYGAAVNRARWAVLKAGLPHSVPGMSVERQCASGLQAICLAAQSILSNHAEVIVAGGVESWSTVPFLLSRYSNEKPFSMEPPRFIDRETGPDRDTNFVMGVTAENLAARYAISREEQDRFALLSNRRALEAIASGKFKDEIVPVTIPQRKGEPVLFEVDERPRETSMEKLAALPPAFKPGGTVTAGNSSGRNDGAVAHLMMSSQKAKELGYTPIGRYVTSAVVGVDPAFMGIGPAYAVPKVLKMAGMGWRDISILECNEAFAAQTLAVVKELDRQGYELDENRLNPNGGAVALGHPNGMSGGRLVLTLLRELKRRGERFGIASLCIGGGQGMAAIFEAL
ncbi:MAG: thiolase family protein [Chloroflexota bacterium]|nr:MAG: thiolase family protein [Chloroflexota bacterium]